VAGKSTSLTSCPLGTTPQKVIPTHVAVRRTGISRRPLVLPTADHLWHDPPEQTTRVLYKIPAFAAVGRIGMTIIMSENDLRVRE